MYVYVRARRRFHRPSSSWLWSVCIEKLTRNALSMQPQPAAPLDEWVQLVNRLDCRTRYDLPIMPNSPSNAACNQCRYYPEEEFMETEYLIRRIDSRTGTGTYRRVWQCCVVFCRRCECQVTLSCASRIRADRTTTITSVAYTSFR